MTATESGVLLTPHLEPSPSSQPSSQTPLYPTRKRAAIYARVSTAKKRPQNSDAATDATPDDDPRSFEQRPEIQIEALTALAGQRGWTVVQVYQDRASGAKEKRPGLQALMTDARRGQFDVVVVWRFDRFARSTKQLVLALEEFQSLGVDFVSYQEALDTSSPMGKAMFTIIAAMAELERSVIRERVIAGLDYAQTHGTKSGNPVGRPQVILRRDEVVRLRDEEHYSWAHIKRELHISTGTARRVYVVAKQHERNVTITARSVDKTEPSERLD